MSSVNHPAYISSILPRTQIVIFLICLAIIAAVLLSQLIKHAFSDPTVVSVAFSPSHEFSKPTVPSITLVEGLGVKDDAHLGTTVQHRSRLHIKPPPANLRQVHLIHQEILDEYKVQPGDLGENVTTKGLNLLGLGKGTRLKFVKPSYTWKEERNAPAIVLQGLRNPCPQIEKFRSGLQEKFIVRDADGKIASRKAGVMGTVERGGEVRAGMKILVEMPRDFVRMESV